MELYSLLENLFRRTAWTMAPPQPYSRFHILLAASGIAAACIFSRRKAKAALRTEEAALASGRVLFSCGLLLAVLEVYKQGFLYFVENNGCFNWWYFPFQLCSIPMYLCLAWPFLPTRTTREIAAGFIQDFGLLGGSMALAFPPGLMHPYWTMTLHGFIWHFILIFAGLYCALSGLTDLGFTGFLHILPLFFACCLTALAINTLTGPGADADMFYISPYHPSSQPVFHQLALKLGIFPGIIAYILAMVLGGLLIHRILPMLFTDV